MSHSSVITELLHKLSKNEFLAQDGGNQRNYKNAKKYRNQLNQLYGAGKQEDEITDGIIADIDTLIPLSVLESFVQKAEERMAQLLADKTRLETELAAAKAAGEVGDTEKNAEIGRLKQQLEKVQTDMTSLTDKLADAEEKLKQKDSEIKSLTENITRIRQKVDDVKGKTVESDPVRALLARLTGTTAAAPVINVPGTTGSTVALSASPDSALPADAPPSGSVFAPASASSGTPSVSRIPSASASSSTTKL